MSSHSSSQHQTRVEDGGHNDDSGSDVISGSSSESSTETLNDVGKGTTPSKGTGDNAKEEVDPTLYKDGSCQVFAFDEPELNHDLHR